MVGDWAKGKKLDPKDVLTLDCNPRQYEALIDDEHFHLLYVGSRRSSKTYLLARWLVKQICKWPRKMISCTVQKRSKARKLLERFLLPIIPNEWLLPGRAGIRRSTDETALCFVHGTLLSFLSGRVPDDARGDGIPALAIDETQIIDPESRENAMLSMSEGGSDMQSLETGTALAGEFEDYYQRALKNERYRVEVLSITDNVHLPTVLDKQTGQHLPEFIISARSQMDPQRFEQEVGRYDPATGRFMPQFVASSANVLHQFRASKHIVKYESGRAANVIRALFSSVVPGVGDDITVKVLWPKFRKQLPWAIGMDFEPNPLVAIACKVFRTPPNVPDLLWAIREFCRDETDPRALARDIKAAGCTPAGVVPDAGGRKSEGGKSSIAIVRAENFDVRGPVQNPYLRDECNAINGKLCNASGDVTMLIDPGCTILLDACKNWRNGEGPGKKPSVMDEGQEHAAYALGHLVHFLWPQTYKRLMEGQRAEHRA